jgi:hypothetical protein
MINTRFKNKWKESVDKCFSCGIVFSEDFTKETVLDGYPICSSCKKFLEKNKFAYISPYAGKHIILLQNGDMLELTPEELYTKYNISA